MDVIRHLPLLVCLVAALAGRTASADSPVELLHDVPTGRTVAARDVVAGEVPRRLAQRPGTVGQRQPEAGLPSETSGSGALTSEILETRLQAARQSQELDEATKPKVVEAYQQAQQELQREAALRADSQRYTRLAETAAGELQQARAELAATPSPPEVTPPAGASLAQLQQLLQQQDADIVELRKSLTALQEEPRKRAARRVELQKLQTAAAERIAEVDKQLAEPAPPDEAAPLTAARRTLLTARRRAAEAEIEAGERELAAYDARVELLPVRRDLAKRAVTRGEVELKAWQTVVNQQRQLDVASQQKQIAAIVADAPLPLRGLAKRIAALADERTEIENRIKTGRAALQQTKSLLESVQQRFNRVQAQVEAVGLTGAVGALLRQQRLALPDPQAYRRASRRRQEEIGDVQFRLLDLQQQRAELSDLDAAIRQRRAELGIAFSVFRQNDLEEPTRALVEAERDVLDSLLVDYNSLFDGLVDLDAAQQQLAGSTQEFRDYVDERVLWVRSSAPVAAADVRATRAAAVWLVSPTRLRELGAQLVSDVRGNPVVWIATLLLLLMLFTVRRRLALELATAGREAERGNCHDFGPTARALAATLLLTAVWPALLAFVAWRLAASGNGPAIATAAANALLVSAAFALPVELLRQTVRRGGLAEAHFEWSGRALQVLRRQLGWLMWIVAPLVAAVALLDRLGQQQWTQGPGRFCFLAAMLWVAFFQQRVLRPTGVVLRNALAFRRGGWLDRLRFLWYPLCVLAPLLLAALAAYGYYYTAQQLALRLHATVCLVAVLLLAAALAMRWVLVNQRRIAHEQARQRLEAAAAETPSEAPPEALDQVDVFTMIGQTQRLLRSMTLLVGVVGLWLIWTDVLPALRHLDRVPLWHTDQVVTRFVEGPDGEATREVVERYAPVTLAHLLIALGILLMTFAATKNIPGLLEIVLLQRLPLDAALRFAFSTVIRYAIILVGVSLALGYLGIGWSKIQWLIAAVSVGLGFGLQEIFANFVSGLILLFERPLRAGDIVTVGDVSGKVLRIRMRATVIQDWDRKELIVPNKEFITGKLLNWTLTDQVNRVVVQVGVAYGTNVAEARSVLLAAAADHPLILDDPGPSVTFDGFGDSALNFTLRAYLPNLDNRLGVTHDLHASIHDRLAAAGIEIPFPQRDVHLRNGDVSPPDDSKGHRQSPGGRADAA